MEISFGLLTSLSAVTKDVPLHPLLSSKSLLNLQPDPKTLCSTHFQVLHSRRNQRSWFFIIWHVCLLQYITLHPIEKQSLKKFPPHCHFCQSCSNLAASQEKLRLAQSLQAAWGLGAHETTERRKNPQELRTSWRATREKLRLPLPRPFLAPCPQYLNLTQGKRRFCFFVTFFMFKSPEKILT